MKAMLLKPIDGLEVGEVYDFAWKHRTDCWVLADETLQNDEIHGWTGSQLFEYFFVFQEIPEQIKEQLYEPMFSYAKTCKEFKLGKLDIDPTIWLDQMLDSLSGLGMKGKDNE